MLENMFGVAILVFAFTALSMLPALLVFVVAQRRIVGGLTSAVKG